jgi:glycosyltransferase involved in cell wall biosynthesis
VHGKTGLLVPPDDATALHDALARLVGDETLRTRMGAAGRQRMQNEFSIATMAAAHLALYESLIAE